jgi:hypothetical protein
VVPLQQLGKKLFMNRTLPPLQRGEFTFVVIDEYDVVTQFSQARAGHKSDIS